MIDKLKQLRQLWGWPQSLVARMLHISRTTLSRWEREISRPRSANQEKLDALVASLEKAYAASSPGTPPVVDIQVSGDAMRGDKVIGRDSVGGDVITTTDGTTYIIRGCTITVLVVTNPAILNGLLKSQD